MLKLLSQLKLNTFVTWILVLFIVSVGSRSAGWRVVFRYKHPTDREGRKIGRAVTMNLDGSDTRVKHVDFICGSLRRSFERFARLLDET